MVHVYVVLRYLAGVPLFKMSLRFFRSPIYHRSSEDDKARSKRKQLEQSSSSPTKKQQSGRTGVNPVTGRPYWRWVDGDEGYRLTGKVGKKKLFHRDIQRGANEIISVGDCAVFLSETQAIDRPYVSAHIVCL